VARAFVNMQAIKGDIFGILQDRTIAHLLKSNLALCPKTHYHRYLVYWLANVIISLSQMIRVEELTCGVSSITLEVQVISKEISLLAKIEAYCYRNRAFDHFQASPDSVRWPFRS
jgi:hypothetical protein